MRKQNGFALAIVILVFLLVTTISIPLILSSGSTNRQINKVEELTESKDDINILLDLVVAKYRKIVEDANESTPNWSDFQLSLDSQINSYIANDLTFDSTIEITVNNITYSGNTEIFSREISVTKGTYSVTQKVNFSFSSQGQDEFELLGLSAGEDIRTEGYLDIEFDVSAGDDFDVFKYGDLNLNNGHRINNYSNNTRFMYTSGAIVDFDDLSNSNKDYVSIKINFLPTEVPDIVDIHKMLYFNILEDYGQDYQTVIDSGLSDNQIFSTYLSSDDNGWRTYDRNTTIRSNRVSQSSKIFVDGDLIIDLRNRDHRTDFSGYTIIATGDVTIISRSNDVYLRTLSSSCKIIAGEDIILDGATNQNGVIFNALLLSGRDIFIENDGINISEDFDFEGVIHANRHVIINNRDRNQTSDYMRFEEDLSVLDGLPGEQGNIEIKFSVNPKE